MLLASILFNLLIEIKINIPEIIKEKIKTPIKFIKDNSLSISTIPNLNKIYCINTAIIDAIIAIIVYFLNTIKYISFSVAPKLFLFQFPFLSFQSIEL